MTDHKGAETYYDLLNVDPRASVAEIVNAYHTAKNAYAKDSIASYSLFQGDEAEKILGQLEQAYLTLSNLERRADYDRRLIHPEGELDANVKVGFDGIEKPQGWHPAGDSAAPAAGPAALPAAPAASAGLIPSVPEDVKMTENDVSLASLAASGLPGLPGLPGLVVPILTESPLPVAPVTAPEAMGGAFFKGVRERRGLSVDDVSRITKIPKNFLIALENDDFKKLPVRVYIQGFIKNMSVLYKIDAQSTASAYLVYFDGASPLNRA